MARIGAFVSLMLVGMDAVAGILGIQAEYARNKMIIDDANMKAGSFDGCREARVEGFRRAVVSTALFAVAHLAANLHGGFICICCMEELERSPNNRQLWFACLVSSWIVAAIGFPLLTMGTMEISKSRGSCTALDTHFLSVGGIFCFIHALFCIFLFVSAHIRFRNNGHDFHS